MRAKAFTLLELLVVVGIIATLAAIAIPNFLEAQTRAKIARAKADLRTVSMALEAYAVDVSAYPFPRIGRIRPDDELNGFLIVVSELTTPVAYLPSAGLPDPFNPEWPTFTDALVHVPWKPNYLYFSYSGWYLRTLPPSVLKDVRPFRGYSLSSVGPDRISHGASFIPLILENPDFKPRMIDLMLDTVYDPSNGTVSGGDIIRWTGKAQRYGSF